LFNVFGFSFLCFLFTTQLCLFFAALVKHDLYASQAVGKNNFNFQYAARNDWVLFKLNEMPSKRAIKKGIDHFPPYN